MSEPVELGAARSARAAIIGNSRAMQAIYKEIGRVAAKPVTVLIRGETGTGKELIARAIYQHSDRADAAVHRRQLRGHPGNAAGKRTVRPRTRRIHRRATPAASAASSRPTTARFSSTKSAT